MSLPVYNLSKDNFPATTSDAFKALRLETDFNDVTLAWDNGEQVDAHKVILSSSSEFFKRILKNNGKKFPLIYLFGINHEFLIQIINFIYLGEVQVDMDKLN